MKGNPAVMRDPDAYEFDRLPSTVCGCRMPTHRGVLAQDAARERAAAAGSAALRDRMLKAMGSAAR